MRFGMNTGFDGSKCRSSATPNGASRMKILALEFSSPQRSVALVQHAAGSESLLESEAIETGASPNEPFALIEEVLRQTRVEREQVDVLALGLGPGSYTGIRSAIALAQGWELARG